MRKNLKALAQAAQAQKNAPESVLFINNTPAEQPEQDAAPEAAPAAEVAQPSVDATAPEAREEKPLFTPLLTPEPAPAPAAVAPAPVPVVAPVAPAPAPAPRSLDDLLTLVRQAKSVTERLTAYKATGEKLNGFELAREGYTDRLTIKDGAGLEWSTTKSSIIQKVLDVLRTDLSAAIDTTEAELRHLLPAA